MQQPWQPLLDWWFGSAEAAAEVAAARGALWFGKQDSQDAEARERFAVLVEQALAGELQELQEWQADAQAWLATILLLDQLPRMLFRDSPRAFAGDPLARQLVQAGLARGWGRQLRPIQRVFVYLVLEHAEDLALQNQAVEHFAELHAGAAASEQALFAGYLDYAERHQRVIARFARFPHRNAILGRQSRLEELQFLQEPGSRF